MSDESQESVTPVVSKASPEQQAEAEKIGWIPATRYKGNPERFVDADEYIKRGETVLPIVKKQLSEVRGENAQLRAEQAKTAAALAAAQKAIEEIEARHSAETQRAVEQARKQLKTQLASASEAGDHEAVAEITDQMTRLNTAEERPVAKKNGSDGPPAFVPPAGLVEWAAENPWYGKDKRKTALALGIAEDLRASGDVTQGRAFFDKVTEELDKMLSPPRREEPRGDKVEGARGGGTDAGGSRKGYASLPPDAKAACDSDARKFVGPGKMFKDNAAWRTHYANIFFDQE